MKRIVVAAASLFLVMTVVVTLPASARDAFVDNLSGYTVEAEILDAPNCAGPVFDDVTLKEFEQGLCVFHRPARSPDDTKAVLDLLDKAQTRGLPPVHQTFATLLTGLAHCSEAKRHRDAFQASGKKDGLERTFFCRERRLAIAELGAIRWNHALFEYTDGMDAARTLDARLTEMSACYAGVLAPSFDAECSLISNISETEINKYVNEAVDKVIKKYFGGEENPITAMFLRKSKRAEGVKKSAETGIAALESDVASVNATYEKLNKAYELALDEKINPIFKAYRDAILRAHAIRDEYERWKGGLFYNSENIDLLPGIKEKTKELEEELTRAKGLEFRSKVLKLLADIRQIINGEEGNRATIASLCRIYFCQLTNIRSRGAVRQVCRQTLLLTNPLCIEKRDVDGSVKMKSGILAVNFEGPQSENVADFCRSAGVDPAFTVLNMDTATAEACLGELP